jgi:Flp pilus assembly pilin Flp
MLERITYEVWRKFGRRDSGQDLLEYALLSALIALAAVSAVTQVGSTIQTVLWDAIDAATNAI